MTDILSGPQWCGFIAQHTGIDTLCAALAEGPVISYYSFGPTVTSPHYGHPVTIKVMRHLQMAGHNPLTLVGGATGLIGDPSGRGKKRNLNEIDVVAGWAAALRDQFGSLLDFEGEHPARIASDLDRTGPMSTIDLLWNIGKNLRLETMLSENTITRRLESDEGISFTEFNYQILQASDYPQLCRYYGYTLEVGGNDQWGNLVGDVDLIRKVEGESVHVVTNPLTTKSDGMKFGKTAGGAIWLNPEIFSPYRFRQFWLNTADDDIIHMLKVFTLRTREEIAELETALTECLHAREMQKALTEDVTTRVHGAGATECVEATSRALLSEGGLESLDIRTLADAVAGLPRAEGSVGAPLTEFFVATGPERGLGAARYTVASGGLYLSNVKIDNSAKILGSSGLFLGGAVLLCRGKKNLTVVEIVQIWWCVSWGHGGDVGL